MKKQRSLFRKTERATRLWLSSLAYLVAPDKRKIFTWRQISFVLFILIFVMVMVWMAR